MFSGRIVQKYTCSVVLHRSQEVIPAGMRRSARVTAKKSLLGSAAAVVEDAIQSSQPRVKRARVVAATAEVDNEPATGHSRTPPAKEPKGISWYHEQLFWDRGFSKVAGVDEAGRGPLAGPVVAAACILPKAGTDIIEGINDSKQLSAEERDSLYEQITTHPEVIWAA